MQNATIVRVGGKAALVLLCAGLNLTFADTLSYFYGYGNPNFGVYQSTDAFSSQNVNLAPTVSMVTVQSVNPTTSFGSTTPSIFAQAATNAPAADNGYSVMVQSYGYSMPATQQSTSGNPTSAYAVTTAVASPTIYTAAANTPSSNSYMAPVAWLNASSAPAATPSPNTAVTNNSIYTPVVLSGSSSYNNAVSVPTNTNSDMSFFGGWGGVQVVVTPRYDATISNTNKPITSPTVNVNVGYAGALGTPEPATMGIVGAGLMLLALKIRRRR